MNRLYLIRHAETEEAFAGHCVGRLDVALSERGREQAAALAAAPPRLSAVYASPLRRALETAEPLAAALGLAVEVSAELRECDFGLLEGRSFAEIEATWPEVYASWMEAPATVRFPQGEAFADVRERAAAFVAAVRAAPGDAAAAVTHAGVVRAVLVEAGGLEPAAAFALDFPHGGVTEVDLSTARSSYTAGRMSSPGRSAVVLTVGNEIVSGDVENTNASWLARRLAAVGIEVKLVAAVRDDVDEIAAFLRVESARTSYVFVTGGLGGTPDDLTREAVATAFGVPTEEQPDVAASLRDRFGGRGLGDYAARWANLPADAEPLENPLGGAPGFVLGNVYVFPGLPSEMEAMFESVAERFRGDPIAVWRRSYRTGEGQIVAVLEDATRLDPAVLVGSYPRFHDDGPEVEVVLKSSDAEALAAVSAWVEEALAAKLGGRRISGGGRET